MTVNELDRAVEAALNDHHPIGRDEIAAVAVDAVLAALAKRDAAVGGNSLALAGVVRSLVAEARADDVAGIGNALVAKDRAS